MLQQKATPDSAKPMGDSRVSHLAGIWVQQVDIHLAESGVENFKVFIGYEGN